MCTVGDERCGHSKALVLGVRCDPHIGRHGTWPVKRSAPTVGANVMESITTIILIMLTAALVVAGIVYAEWGH